MGLMNKWDLQSRVETTLRLRAREGTQGVRQRQRQRQRQRRKREKREEKR
jgi:hypothetical protein